MICASAMNCSPVVSCHSKTIPLKLLPCCCLLCERSHGTPLNQRLAADLRLDSFSSQLDALTSCPASLAEPIYDMLLL